MYSSILKNKTTLFVVLLAGTAPLFNLRIIASVTLFDLFVLCAMFVFGCRSMNIKTILMLVFFTVLFLVSESSGLNSVVQNGAKFWDSVNIFFRYIILLFVIPYLSFRLFYSGPDPTINIRFFYNVLMFSFFLVLVFNMYAIYYQIEDYFFLQRFCSIYGNANTAALVFNIMSVLYLFNTNHSNSIIRIICYLSIPLTIASLVVTGSFSGYLTQALIFSVFLFKAINIKTLFIVILAGVVLFSVDFSGLDEESEVSRGLTRFSGLVSMISSSDDIQINEVGSAGERITSIEMSLLELSSSPSYLLSGIGFGNVETLVKKRTGARTSIHLVYLQLMLSIGVLGTLMYSYVFGRVILKIPRYLVDSQLVVQSTVLLVVFLFIGMFIPHTYLSFYFAPIFPVLGLYGVDRGYA